MPEEDYYQTLGVGRDATQAEIKKAYRGMALKYHPDRNPGDAQAADRFKKAAEAYEVLGNDETRRRYDLYGKAGLEGVSLHEFTSAEDIFSVFSDFLGGTGFFDDFFGATRARRAARGRNLRVVLDVELREVLSGTEKTITLRRAEPCPQCEGRGAPADGVKACSHCRGYGQVETRQAFFRMRTTCPRCGGRGTVIAKPCPACAGAGRLDKEAAISVKVPAGVESGTRLRVRGEGESLPGGPPGDLYCDIYVREHPVFARSGPDLLCEVPISYSTAALGGIVLVPSLEGEACELSIPRSTQSGELLRVRGLGLPDMQAGGRGDLLARAIVETPQKLTPRQEELLRELAEIENVNVSERRKSFLDRIKDYLYAEGKAGQKK